MEWQRRKTAGEMEQARNAVSGLGRECVTHRGRAEHHLGKRSDCCLEFSAAAPARHRGIGAALPRMVTATHLTGFLPGLGPLASAAALTLAAAAPMLTARRGPGWRERNEQREYQQPGEGAVHVESLAWHSKGSAIVYKAAAEAERVPKSCSANRAPDGPLSRKSQNCSRSCLPASVCSSPCDLYSATTQFTTIS
jgi:hypothetical protein